MFFHAGSSTTHYTGKGHFKSTMMNKFTEYINLKNSTFVKNVTIESANNIFCMFHHLEKKKIKYNRTSIN